MKIFSSRPSNGARALALAMGIKRIRRINYIPRVGEAIINWGSSELPAEISIHPGLINKAFYVCVAANKREFFQVMTAANVLNLPRCVPSTTNREIAQQWSTTGPVVVRNVLTGHSGNGIIIVEINGTVPQAPLYTKYIKKDSEYRVHIVRGEVIDVQKKIRDPGKEPTDWKVRSHANGFIFVRTGFTTPDDVLVQSKLCFDRSGLDFGAVDVLWNQHQASAYVLEINTAPGLEGQTVQNYATALGKI